MAYSLPCLLASLYLIPCKETQMYLFGHVCVKQNRLCNVANYRSSDFAVKVIGEYFLTTILGADGDLPHYEYPINMREILHKNLSSCSVEVWSAWTRSTFYWLFLQH